MTETIDWLKTRAYGFNLLSDKEINAISEFTLLWSLFEQRILNTEGSARAICEAVDAWQQAGILDTAMLDPELSYFRHRYYSDGALTNRFDHLGLPNNELKLMVSTVIDCTDNDPRDRFAAVLIIVFRYRNNLFHGVKWQYKLADQLSNFMAANAFLMKVLDRYGALAEG